MSSENCIPTESGRDHGGKPYFYGTADASAQY